MGTPFLLCGEGKVYLEAEVLEAHGDLLVGFAGSNCRDSSLEPNKPLDQGKAR